MVERYRGGSCCYHSPAVDFFSDSGSALCGYCIIEGTCLLGVLHKPSATQLFPLVLHFAYKTIHMYVQYIAIAARPFVFIFGNNFSQGNLSSTKNHEVKE